MQGHFDIGIVGGWCHTNYGDEIAHYALYSVVESMKYSAIMLQWPADSIWEPRNYLPMFRENPYPEYAISEAFNSSGDLRKLNDKCDIFLTGPGQYHNPGICHLISDMPLLGFVNNNRLKIAYAASWGHDPMTATEHEKAYFSYYFRQFDAFSVREIHAKEYAAKELSVDAEWVLDPVLICDQKILHELADKAINNPPRTPFVFSYMLDNSSQNETILKYYENQLGLPLRVAAHDSYLTELNLPWGIETLTNFMVEDWLAHFKHCEWLVTDSFHGTCMAITFKKPFIVILRQIGGVSRIYSLLKLLGLENRIIDGEKVLYDDRSLFEPIDYVSVHEILNNERNRSLNWLKSALSRKPVSRSYSLSTILDQRIEEMERYINKRTYILQQEIRNICRDEIDKINQKRIEELIERNNQMQQDFRNIYSSRSYRLARYITWMPRKIRGGYRCIREHGIKYTVVYFCKKVMNKLSA